MKTAGIIAEYNPFHKGHARQIDFLRQQGVETIAVVLSGPFLQRGTPAWTDKTLRTKMALLQGVDLVFELPVLYAVSSAETFARGGVSLLNTLPLDSICFGMECQELTPLQKIADFLAEQDHTNRKQISPYQQQLRTALEQGLSYPVAREQAIKQFFPELLEQYPHLLSAPNNILALEYLKACRRSNSPLQPVALQRNDSGYHSETLSETFSSATAIRKEIEGTSLKSCQSSLPEDIYALLADHPTHYPIRIDDLSQALYAVLRRAGDPEELTLYGRISPELARRILHLLPDYTNISSYIDALKTKNKTYSHISRALICLLLGITTRQLTQTEQEPPYLRLLGMRRQKSHILRQVTQLPVITKTADYRQILTNFYQSDTRLAFALECFETDLRAADIYRQTMYHKTDTMLPDEFHTTVQLL